MASTTQIPSPARSTAGTPRRPGLVTFAAIVTLTQGALFVLLALSEFADSYWFYNNSAAHVYDLASSHLLWWGIFDSILAAFAIAGGISILRGGIFGMMMGILLASCSMLRWMFYIPATPWLAVTILAIDVLVLYAICSSLDYFAEASGP
jgi:hypothetical protein